jgi:hypothetical protein
MQAGDPYGSGGSGWAGRAADTPRARNAASTFPPGISFAGPSLFCSANLVQSTSLLPGLNLAGDGMSAWPASAAAAKVQALQVIVSCNSGLSLVQAAKDARADGTELNGMFNGLGHSSGATVFPGTNIGQQFQQVAQLVSLRAATGMNLKSAVEGSNSEGKCSTGRLWHRRRRRR